MMHRHRWVEVECIGVVVTERCAVCPKTRTRLRAAVGDSAVSGIPGHPTALVNRSTAATAAERSISGDAVPHRIDMQAVPPSTAHRPPTPDRRMQPRRD